MDENNSTKQEGIVLVDNTVLCYLNCIYGKRPNLSVQQTLSSFYSEGELENAKAALLHDCELHVQDLPATVKAKHKQSIKKKQMDANDLLSIIEHLDTGGHRSLLSCYVTSSVLRIPGEDPDCCDPKVLQSEVKMLRNEVKKLSLFITEKLKGLESKIDKSQAQQVSVAKPLMGPSKDSVAVNQLGMIRVEDNLCYFGKVSPLSNFFSSSVRFDDRVFATAEHLYQYRKALSAGKVETANQIAKSHNPAEAKNLGNSVTAPEAKNDESDDWNDCLLKIMAEVSLLKFEQNAAPRKYLLQTNDLKLIEATRDPFWGCGVALTDEAIREPSSWFGNNEMGKILMEVRGKLQSVQEPMFELGHYAAEIPELPQNNWATEFPGLPDVQSQSKVTFSDVLKTEAKWNLVTSKKNVIRTKGNNDEKTALKGVERIISEDFYVGQLAETTTLDEFKVYLENEGIQTSLCYKLPSKIPNTSAFRFRCQANLKYKILDSSTWPNNVTVRPWVWKPKPSLSPSPYGGFGNFGNYGAFNNN